MSTINDVEPVLQSILDKGSVLTFNDYVNTINYDVVLRTKLSEGETPPQQCDNWVSKFSAVTNSHWIVKNTSPYAVRVLYKKSYTCKNKKCNAKINIIFKKNNRNTRKNDPLLAQGLTAVIKIIFKHNHDVYCPALSIPSQKIEPPFEKYKYNHIPSPQPVKPVIDDQNQDYSMDNDSSDSNDVTEQALKLVNIPIDDVDSSEEISRFKHELQRISNIVEDTKSGDMVQYLKTLNDVLENVSSEQTFYEVFGRIVN